MNEHNKEHGLMMMITTQSFTPAQHQGVGNTPGLHQRQGLLATPKAAKELLEVLPQFTAKSTPLLTTSQKMLEQEVGKHWKLNTDAFSPSSGVVRMENLITPTPKAGQEGAGIVGKAAKTMDAFIQGLQKQDDSVTLTGVKHMQRIKPGGQVGGDTLHLTGRLANGQPVERRLPARQAHTLGPNMFEGLPERFSHH